uniref:Reverse transcriptase domain-containing protein n=1 Tax=Tanacetum cinerariifolium TaxID=118510 RepID=A0A699JAF8_TANCI|nr:hypothetical protein [Tanacetum cinerariifolium]
MCSTSSTVTYTSVYTDSELGRPVAPPSLDYIPGPEEPQTPPVPQDEDEREPMFIQPHDPNYVSGPLYPEFKPLKDEHVFSVEEQPLPPVVSPTVESPGYVAGSDLEEDLEEYQDEESEDGLVDYPMDGGDDGDDDNGDSSGDDADDEDEDKEEEHLALAHSTVVVPAKAKVERLLVMPTPPPSLLTSLSPPSAEERLARYEIRQSSTARLTGGQGIDYGFVITLDAEARRRRIGEVRYGIRDTWVDLAKAVPKIAPMTVREVNTKVTELAELHEHDTHDLYALLEDAQDSRTRISQRVTTDSQQAVPKIAPMTVREVNTKVTELAELHEHDTHDLYALLEDAQDSRTRISQRVTTDSQQLHAHQTHLQLQGTLIQTQHQVHEIRFQMQQTEMSELQETDRKRQAQMVEILRVMGDMR